MNKEQFAKYLKLEKQRLGMNHNQFAELIGHSRDSYMAWYKGVNGCPDDKQDAIKKILLGRV